MASNLGRAQNRHPVPLDDFSGETADPILFPEVQVSRQFAFHVLLLPGETEPTWHRFLHQAIEQALLHDFDSLTLVIGEEQYRLSLNKGDP